MVHVIAAACQTGNWQQKAACGMHGNSNVPITATFAQTLPSFMPVLAIVLVVLFIVAVTRRGRSGSPAPSK
ncbi:MAG TPA: hypothetical protein VMK84_02825 [Streptosporangiaceae bacterium]|nr:hypothetical protein [Streptosporangiaceae bacterium]